MMWVAVDRGLRLAEKRSLPCPQRPKWEAARDQLYEDIMEKVSERNKRVAVCDPGMKGDAV